MGELRYCPTATAEPVTVPAMLPVLSGTPGSTRWAGPELGQHTKEVLRDLLQMTDDQYAELRTEKII